MIRMLFLPAIAAMNRMNFVIKFILIGLLLLLPFAYVTHLMMKGSDKQIDFNQKESFGVEYITPAFRFLGKLQDLRTASAAALAGEASYTADITKKKGELQALIPAIDDIDTKYKAEFRTDDGNDLCSARWAEIKEGWLKLRDRNFTTQEESFKAHTELCALVTDWILNYAANYSNLILDPDLDSYWLMDAFVAKLPQITENLSQACARSIAVLHGLEAQPDNALTMDQRLQLHALVSDGSITLNELNSINLKTAFTYNNTKNKRLQPRLGPPAESATRLVHVALENLKDRLIKPQTPGIESGVIHEQVGNALVATYGLYEIVGPELNDLIVARVKAYSKDKVLGIVASEVATFLHVYLFIAFYMAIHASVSKISGFTRRMIEGTEEHFKLDSRDELGVVAESYNQINQTLIETRALKTQVEHRTAELQASEERFRTLASNAPVGIFMTNALGDCEYVNAACCAMAGFTPEEARGKGWSKFLHPDDRERVVKEWSHATRTGRPFASEYRFGKPEGTVTWIAGNAVVLTDRAGLPTGFLGSVTDITERKRVEKLKNEFISTVSHELRTPLTSIRGSLGLISGGVAGALQPKAKSMIDIAQKNCERLVRLVNDILDIEKIESGKMTFNIKPLDLLPLIEQSIEANRAYAATLGVSIRLDNLMPGVKVVADADRLNQVLTNLMSNAAKFSPRGETVTVSLSRRAGFLRILVSDRGAGIPEDFQVRIFQKFAQADGSDNRARQGTGLGLSICKAIVEKMGGQIGFRTAKGAGTTFYFDLPEERTQDAPLSPPHQPGRPTILVCEDDADIATVLVGTLDQSGYNVDVAISAARAKELLAERTYAGMTLDIAMPGQDGISLVRELREETATRNLPIVIISAFIEEGCRSLNGEAFGIVDWLEKPIDETRLRKALGLATTQVGGRKPRILHVEDDADITTVVRTALADTAEVVASGDLKDARRRIATDRFDLMILDIGLPDGSGLELLPVLRSSHQAALPVLVFSAQEVSPKTTRHVAASLMKSATTNEELIETIKSLLSRPPSAEPAPLVEMKG